MKVFYQKGIKGSKIHRIDEIDDRNRVHVGCGRRFVHRDSRIMDTDEMDTDQYERCEDCDWSWEEFLQLYKV